MSASARPVCVIGDNHDAFTCIAGLAELGWRVNTVEAGPPAGGRMRPPAGHGVGGLIRCCEGLSAAASGSQVVIIAIESGAHTDYDEAGGLAAALERLSAVEFDVRPTVVLRSAMQPGTSSHIAASIADWADLLYAPPFLAGDTQADAFRTVDRILIGCDEPAQCQPYMTLLQGLQRPVLVTTFPNAELIACCANVYRGMSAAFAGEVKRLCTSLGAGSDDVLRGVGYAHNYSADVFESAIGPDASWFVNDILSIESLARRQGLDNHLFSGLLRVSDAEPEAIVKLLESEIGLLARKTIGVWGLMHAPDSGAAAAPRALRIVQLMSDRGASSVVYDPRVHSAALPSRSRLVCSALEAATADALLVLTAYPEFAQLDPLHYAGSIGTRLIVDTCNALDGARMCAAGLHHRRVEPGPPHVHTATRPRRTRRHRRHQPPAPC